MKYTSTLLLLLAYVGLYGQVSFTANDLINPYEGSSFFGTNMGYYEGWQDEQLADIAAGNPTLEIPGMGVQSLRPTLPESFLNYWGYDIRIAAFEHYKNLGLRDHTCFLQEPSPEHRETFMYCNDEPSHLFANIYLDIWDDGENGTPVNDDNFYALYVYKTVNKYKDYIKFWEIWNEPDFAFTSNSTNPPGIDGNWWENNPDPCEYKLHAPIFHYIRTLRISYEVIKSIDPDAYVAVGGLGYPSFLDAILRNTDNPEDGSISSKYQNRGGAYFDILSYHSYPHIDNSLRTWSNMIQGFEYSRHSDEAVNGLMNLKGEFEEVLFKYGYTGNQYPEKLWIITEANIPRVKFGEFIGSDAAQRNFMIKSLIMSKMDDVIQFHVFNLGEANSIETDFNEFDFMGLYKPLAEAGLYNQKATDGGVAYHTTAKLLGNTKYDPNRTRDMNLPAEVKGGAFVDDEGNYTYVLWATTHTDESELTSATYSLPAQLGTSFVEIREWDFSRNNLANTINAQDIVLTGSPVFLRPTETDFKGPETFDISVYPNPFSDSLVINYNVERQTVVTIEIVDVAGKLIDKITEEKQVHAEGIYQLMYDTTELPNGVYLCRMTTTNDIFVAKMVKR